MRFAHIVAASENGVIGVNGALPWHLKADLKRFKEMTTGHCLLMGRKTFDSIGRALKDRLSIVVSRNSGFAEAGVITVGSVEEAVEASKSQKAFDQNLTYILGGGEIYKATMSLVDDIFLTRIFKSINGDTYYPNPADLGFELIEEQRGSEADLEFAFQQFKRAT